MSAPRPSRLRRLFADGLPEQGGELVLPSDSAHHARVLRLAPGDRVQLFDGRLGQADAIIVELSRERAVCRAEPCVRVPAPEPALHVVLGLPKGGKVEDIARMLTELGVTSLHLALCERSVPRPGDTRARMARLARVAMEACAQSGQPLAPRLHAPAPLAETASRAPAHARKLVFWEEGGAALGAALSVEPGPPREVWAVIGPEGGLEPGEVAQLAQLGYAAVGLGTAILRVETAAPVVAALLLERLGRLTP